MTNTSCSASWIGYFLMPQNPVKAWKVELFTKIVNGLKPWIAFVKSSTFEAFTKYSELFKSKTFIRDLHISRAIVKEYEKKLDPDSEESRYTFSETVDKWAIKRLMTFENWSIFLQEATAWNGFFHRRLL